ncbi:MAG TPA: PrsW family intramembrane metalloprotease [Myxococcota bacterium]|jgi:hypothetical protein|nr:PrsW family intramembrane metalloprotease [Myxococcota bacterium]
MSPVLLLSFLPGVLWLVWFTRYDRVRPEPKRLVALVFFLGMVSTFAAGFLNDFLGAALHIDRTSIGGLFLLFFVVVGPVEEGCKLLVVRATVYRHKEFDEPIDAFVYAAAAALGFASLENLFYGQEFGTGALVLRAVLSVPGHVLFSALWGYGLASKKFRGGRVLPWWLAAAFSHGLYDFLVIGGGSIGAAIGLDPALGHLATFLLGVVPLVAVQWIVLMRLIRRLNVETGALAAAEVPAAATAVAAAAGAVSAAAAASPSIPAPRPRMTMATARAIMGVRWTNPTAARTAPAPAPAQCPACQAGVEPGHPFCGACGTRLTGGPATAPEAVPS